MAGQGRYPTITKEISDFIFKHVGEGISVRKVCDMGIKEIEGFPSSRSTIFHWLILAEEKDAPQELIDFSDQYHKAQQAKAESLADDMTDISDDDSLDLAFKEDGTSYIDREHIMRSKLRVDTRKWVAERLLPKKYGARVEQSNRFVDKEGNDIQVNVTIGEKK